MPESVELSLPSLIESCLFVSDTPVTDRRMAEVLSRPVSEVRAGIQELRTLYAARGSALEVVEIAEGYRLATRPELEQTLAKLFGIRRIQRLSRAALEVLSIIAYRHRAKDPATAQDVEHIRGVDSYAVLKGLMEQDFIRIAGRKEVPGAPHLYVTTTRFQEYFGLKDLTDMPDETELDALFKESVQPVIETAPAGSAPRISASGASSVGVSDSDPAPQVPASPTPAPPEPPSHEPSPAPGS